MTEKHQWGPWTLDPENMTLDFSTTRPRWEHLHYEIDLAGINSSARMLDWIFQIHKKPWADAPTLKALLNAFHDLFHPQECLCSFGNDLRIDAKEVLRAALTTAE